MRRRRPLWTIRGRGVRVVAAGSSVCAAKVKKASALLIFVVSQLGFPPRSMRARRLVRPFLAAAGGGVAWAGRSAEWSPSADAAPDMHAASRLRNAALRAQAVLSEPPQMLGRCARAEWRRHARSGSTRQPDAVDELERCQTLLRDTFSFAAREWQASQRVKPDTLEKLAEAADSAETAVSAAREAAVRGALLVPWENVLHGLPLERASGEPTGKDAGSLRGKTVALYFTASWCGPCRRFTPKLVQLYDSFVAAASRSTGGEAASVHTPFEVVLVSWDEDGTDRCRYAKDYGMNWLALPYSEAARKATDELTLRYDVKSIPSLIVLEVSPDGKSERVVSRDGRMDLERGQAPWLPRVPGPVRSSL
jgi:nucleoredoxin